MTTTFIKTGECRRVKLEGSRGEVAEILNQELCGAKNVHGSLRWLAAGDRLDAGGRPAAHELVYLMEGKGVITLAQKDYEVAKGAGIYLGPSESASIRHAGGSPLKLFHLVVPKVER